MKKILSIGMMLLSASLLADVTARISGEDSAGNREVTLENELVRAKFSTLGGRLTSLVNKADGRDLVWGTSGGDSGSMKDQFPPMSYEFRNGQYSARIVSSSPEKAVVELKSASVEGRWKFQSVTRTVSLSRGETALRCGLEIANHTENMAPVTLGYWSHNFFGTAGEENRVFMPTEKGPVSFVPTDATNNRFVDDLSRGWAAVIGRSGLGVVCLPEYKRLDVAYSWHCRASAMPLDTLEWRLRPEIIPEGGSLKTNFSVAVVSGLDKIDGAGDAGCGVVELPTAIEPNAGITAKIRMKGFSSRPVKVRLLVDGKAVSEQKSELSVGKVTEVEFSMPGRPSGASALAAEVLGADGSFLFDMSEPLRVGGSGAQVRFAPREKRIASAVDAEPWDFQLSDAVATPHYKWAVNAAPVKAMFLMPTNGARDIVELRQRMALDAAFPTIWPGNYEMSWRFNACHEPGQTGLDKLSKLFEKPVDRQVFVTGVEARMPWDERRAKWKNLPENVRKHILAAVREGAGLVCVNLDDPDEEMKAVMASLKPFNGELSRSMDLSAAPHFQQAQILAGDCGKGRVFMVKYKSQAFLAPHAGGRVSDMALLKNDHRFQEYQFAILTRLIGMAAGRKAVLSEVSDAAGSLKIRSETAGRLTVDIFDKYSEPVGSTTRDVQAGEAVVPLEGLRDGNNYVHARLDGADGKVLDFGYAVCKANVEPNVSDIKLPARSFAPGVAVEGEAVVSGALPQGAGVTVTVEDGLGRELLRTGSAKFSWNQKGAVVGRHIIKARVEKDGRVLDERRREFFLPAVFDATANFPNLLWTCGDCWPEYSIPARFEKLAEFGFNFLYAAGVAEPDYCRLLKYANTESGVNWHGPGFFHSPTGLNEWQKTHDKKYLAKQDCPNNPESIKKAMKNVDNSVEIFKDFGTRHLFQLGDEMSMTWYDTAWDVCICKHCLAAFREWLKKRHPSLEALNSRWATSFASWDDVAPMTRVEVLAHPSPAPWVEHRRFMDESFSGLLLKEREKLREIYPGAIVGPTGVKATPGVYGGNWNFWDMSRLDCVSLYGSGRVPLSFNRDGRMVMRYRGYVSHEGDDNYTFWEGVLTGERGTNNWYGGTFLLPDLRSSEVRSNYSKILWELRGGVGDLLYHSSKEVSQVAVLHSQNSLMSNFLKERKNSYYNKELSFSEALEDIGLAYRFVSPEEVEAGCLDKFKALILTESTAMSDREVAKVRDFVAKGGVLVADYEAALQDELCNKRKTPALDDLFGVDSSRASLARTTSSSIPDITVTQAGNGVKLAGGEAAHWAESEKGKIPLVISKKLGAGRAVFLNFATEYDASRPAFKDAGFRRLLSDVLGLAPVAQASAESLHPIMHATYTNGSSRYLTLLPAPPRGEWKKMTVGQFRELAFPAKLKLADSRHLYDARAGKYLGEGRSFDLRLAPGDGAVLAVLPYKVRAVSSDIPAKALAGEALRFNVGVEADKAPGHHVLVATVFRPDGSEAAHYRRILSVKDGRGVLEIPFALNDPTGSWKVRVKDASTGTVLEGTVSLEAARK